MNYPTTSDTYIDSRDVIAAIEEIEEILEEDSNSDEKIDPADREEYEKTLKSLKDLAEEGEYVDDWEYGATLIRDDVFVEYAREYADDMMGAMENQTWPHNHIDWESAASDLQQDFTEIDWEGETYWSR